MKDLCLFACSDQFQLSFKALEYVELIQSLGRQFGVELTHLDYSVGEDENGNVISNDIYLDTDGAAKLKQISDSQSICELALSSDRVENPYFELQSEWIETGGSDSYKFMYIQIPMKYVDNLPPADTFSLMVNSITSLNQIGRLDYALVTIMDAVIPSTYFRGIGTSDLSKNDVLDLTVWERRLNERKTKLRGVYWGNLLGPQHIIRLPDKQAFIARLETLLGSDRLVSINGEALFFMLPSSEPSLNPVKASIEELLMEYDLLMQPDDEVRESVEQSLKILALGKKE
jgi:hypothetical protein